MSLRCPFLQSTSCRGVWVPSFQLGVKWSSNSFNIGSKTLVYIASPKNGSGSVTV